MEGDRSRKYSPLRFFFYIKPKKAEKIIKFLNFGQIHPEPSESEIRKVPFPKWGAPPQMSPTRIKKIIPKEAQR